MNTNSTTQREGVAAAGGPDPSGSLLRAEGLSKRYKKRTVVSEVSIQVRQGEIVGLLGPNGAGKTTTFYMIVGMVRPNGGRVIIDANEMTTMPMYRRAAWGSGICRRKRPSSED